MKRPFTPLVIFGFVFGFIMMRMGSWELTNTTTTVEPELITLAPTPTPTLTPAPTPERTPAPLPSPMIDPRPREIYVSLGEFRLTAYCGCTQCCGKWGIDRPLDANGKPIVYTANQSVAKQGLTIAADINLLPYGTALYVDGHKYVVQDCGGAILGKRLDIYFEHHADAWAFGVKHREVFVLRSLLSKTRSAELIMK